MWTRIFANTSTFILMSVPIERDWSTIPILINYLEISSLFFSIPKIFWCQVKQPWKQNFLNFSKLPNDSYSHRVPNHLRIIWGIHSLWEKFCVFVEFVADSPENVQVSTRLNSQKFKVTYSKFLVTINWNQVLYWISRVLTLYLH